MDVPLARAVSPGLSIESPGVRKRNAIVIAAACAGAVLLVDWSLTGHTVVVMNTARVSADVTLSIETVSQSVRVSPGGAERLSFHRVEGDLKLWRADGGPLIASFGYYPMPPPGSKTLIIIDGNYLRSCVDLAGNDRVRPCSPVEVCYDDAQVPPSGLPIGMWRRAHCP